MKKVFALAVAVFVLASVAAYAQVITDFEGFASGGNGSILFRQPSFSGSTSGLLDSTVYNLAQLSTEKAASGAKSIKVQWQWKGAANTDWLRLTTYNVGVLPNPTIDFNQWLNFKVYFDAPEGAQLGVSLLIRETNTTAAIGANGGAAGATEIIGATGKNGSSPKAVKSITAGSGWQTLAFKLSDLPGYGFAGASNGKLDSTTGKGVLESVCLSSFGVSGPYTLYLDDFSVSSVPEPGSLLALASGLVGMAGFVIRRRK